MPQDKSLCADCSKIKSFSAREWNSWDYDFGKQTNVLARFLPGALASRRRVA
jgi:hypothetical protein